MSSIKAVIRGEIVEVSVEDIEKAFRYIEKLEMETDVLRAYAKAGWDIVYKPERDRIKEQYAEMVRKIKGN